MQFCRRSRVGCLVTESAALIAQSAAVQVAVQVDENASTVWGVETHNAREFLELLERSFAP
jgi:hypothetical protein